MNNVTVHRQLVLRLTADEWSLYEKPCDEPDALTVQLQDAYARKRNMIAIDINSAVQGQVNGAKDRFEAERDGRRVLLQYATWGAADTEGYATLHELVNLRFPLED